MKLFFSVIFLAFLSAGSSYAQETETYINSKDQPAGDAIRHVCGFEWMSFDEFKALNPRYSAATETTIIPKGTHIRRPVDESRKWKLVAADDIVIRELLNLDGPGYAIMTYDEFIDQNPEFISRSPDGYINKCEEFSFDF
ncbi:MAG: hypothetical protein AAGM21_12855 [Pseudomonadota bacterium]